MSTATLTNLLEYLYETLSPNNMRWVGEHLIEHANKKEEPIKRYTMEDLNAMLDEAEADITAGRVTDHEESMRKWKEKLAHEEEFELAQAAKTE